MQARILDIYESGKKIPIGAEIKLTFRYFIDYLKKRVELEDSGKKEFFAYAIKKFTDAAPLGDYINIEEIVKFKEQLTLLYNMLMPVIGEEKETLWALAVPLSPTVFFGTDAFYSLLTDTATGELKCTTMQDSDDNSPIVKKVKLVYSYLLSEFYDYDLPNNGDMVQTFTDEDTGLQKYFSAKVDTRFVKVFARQELPSIDFKSLQRNQLHNDVDWHLLFSILPLSMFRFEGFTIVTITDVTSSQVIENIKNTIINRPDHESDDYYNSVIQSLRILAGNQHIHFRFLPALRVNGALVFNDRTRLHSLMVQTNIENGISEDEIEIKTEQYLKEPKLLFFSEITEEHATERPLLRGMKNKGVVSYALMPVYYNNKIAGVLEAYSYQKDQLDENVLSKVEAATPLLAQLLQQSIDEFDNSLESIIKDKFTSLQPAVQWKFNEVAWHYFRDAGLNSKKALTENILFPEVYPLYGAIDIRNSTVERNLALKADLRLQFSLLIETLQAIKQQLNIDIADELAYQCKVAMNSLEDDNYDNDYIRIREFLDVEVGSFLLHFKDGDARVKDLVKVYFDAINEETGTAFSNRRSLEQSMQTINSAVNQFLEQFKVEMQNVYPCYFEKFRTDGVEYDMYIGQSISPSNPFNLLYLKNVRLKQVAGMAGIARITHDLLPQLSKPLETTQLIFIHSGSIDISFRNDERRFDVEGAYNIRYQVVKKRIDKVTIRNSHERLTQPGKIAMVYFNKKDADEYVGYINYLQDQQILGPEIEYLDLEELQGVNGLKALRVDVLTDIIVPAKTKSRGITMAG